MWCAFYSTILSKHAHHIKTGELLPSMKNRKTFIVVLVVLSFLLLVGNTLYRYYLDTTKEIPIPGGTYTEGIVGQPIFLNPVFAVSDVDQDITSLLFSGLVKINEKGDYEPNLAESWEVSQNGKQYDFFLRENVSWHDGQLFTSDDVFFTIAVLQNPDTRSPLKANYQNLTLEKVSPYHIRFHLPSPYAFFLNSMTIGILPYHILRDLPPDQLLSHPFNLSPVGTGPFMFKKLVQKKNDATRYASIIMSRNPNYYIKTPYLDSCVFKFYPSSIDLLTAYQRREVDGISSISAMDLPELKHTNITLYYLRIPEMKVIFFNLTSETPLRDATVRNVLKQSIPKQLLIDELFNRIGFPISGPLLEQISLEEAQNEVPLDTLQAMLEGAGWKQTPDQVRMKDNQPLTFSLFTDDNTENLQIASFLQTTWQKLGINAEVEIFYQKTFIHDYLEPKNYDAVLLKVNMGSDPDQYPLWHSSQANKETSFNFSNYTNPKVDVLLEDARRILDVEKRYEKYKLFEQFLLEDNPALFLYAPYYIYGVDQKVHGLSLESINRPADRFQTIPYWFVQTKRIAK